MIIIVISLNSLVLSAEEVVLKCTWKSREIFGTWRQISPEAMVQNPIVISLNKETRYAYVFDTKIHISSYLGNFTVKDFESVKYSDYVSSYSFSTSKNAEELRSARGGDSKGRHEYEINRQNLSLSVRGYKGSSRGDKYICEISNFSFSETVKSTTKEEINYRERKSREVNELRKKRIAEEEEKNII